MNKEGNFFKKFITIFNRKKTKCTFKKNLFRIQDTGFRIQNTEDMIQDTGYRIQKT